MVRIEDYVRSLADRLRKIDAAISSVESLAEHQMRNRRAKQNMIRAFSTVAESRPIPPMPTERGQEFRRNERAIS